MRIAFIVNKFPVLSETFILNQITGLICRGHEVHVYGYRPDDTAKYHPDVEKYDLLKSTFYAPNLPQNKLWRLLKALWLIITNFYKAPLVILRSLNFFRYHELAASLRILYSIIPLLNSESYDIIHSQFGIQGNEGMIYREIGAIQGKLITTFRGYDISWYVKEYGENVYDQLFVKGDFFLANCEFFRQRAIKLGCDEKKIIVHGSGIDCSRFSFRTRQPLEDGKISIATTGRLVEKKGIEYGIRAVAKVLKIYPNLEYNIIGDGALKEHLEQVIIELGVAEQVKLLGWKNQKEIIQIIDNTHIFIAPSVTAKDGNQDAPVNTLKEAMAMGLPVIATRHGGIPELVEDGISGFLVPERDANAIADKLTYLIEHPELWEKMGKAGRAYVEKHYDTNHLNDELVKIYQQVIMNDLQLSPVTPQSIGKR
ncbi:MAG: colanic acid biosynthesis glycosyltransferase WcaL [Hapalosiphonaceae cyanobacterium JJU2]|nr:MAG: colanic acid biosynthesis glycosyltransferase WcaL [Hapalosiphonaceae cyanobacterium JJU2]